MKRAVLSFAILALLGPGPLSGQEQAAPSLVYEAYYKIGFADLEQWNRQYREYAIPVLRALQGEGVIEGWTQWQHMTGSEYNIRFAVRAYDWAGLDTFWSEYLSRLEAAMPAEEWDAGGRMITEHTDEIWNIEQANVPADITTTHMYASVFWVSFADMEEWNGLWTDVAAPILEEAMTEGILGGWAKLNHNTGGPFNSKVLYFFEEWDDIDDLFAKLIGTMSEESPEKWARANELFAAHDDAIYTPTAEDEM